MSAGKTPDSWHCIDCGFNTGPGMKIRAEIYAAVAQEGCSTSSIDFKSEVYIVHAWVWAAAKVPPMGGCLCIGCLEKRIGRKLRPNDFPRKHPLNYECLPCSERLRQRRGGRTAKAKRAVAAQAVELKLEARDHA